MLRFIAFSLSALLLTTFQRVDAMRVHRIDGGGHLVELGASSKANVSWSFLSRLHHLWREAAGFWQHARGNDLGRRSTVDLGREFLQ